MWKNKVFLASKFAFGPFYSYIFNEATRKRVIESKISKSPDLRFEPFVRNKSKTSSIIHLIRCFLQGGIFTES